MQWGAKLVFWAGHKALGGKMFAIMDLETPLPAIAFAAGQEHAAELCESEGFRPAPYLARAHWVAVERWDVLPARAWEQELRAAHQQVYNRLPLRTQQRLLLPKAERARLIAEHAVSEGKSGQRSGTRPAASGRKRA